LKCELYCVYYDTQVKWYDAKGDAAARLRQRKHAVLRRFQIPPDALPGSLALTHRRCGTPTCRCAKGEGHPLWSLTFMVDGKKRVERIPDAVAEVFAANAQLLALWRRQSTPQRPRKR
jgi:hypothetical protein